MTFCLIFALFPFRSFLDLFRGVFEDIFNWMLRRSVSWSIFLATGTKPLSLIKNSTMWCFESYLASEAELFSALSYCSHEFHNVNGLISVNFLHFVCKKLRELLFLTDFLFVF